MKMTEPRALNRIASYCSRTERCEYDVRRKLAAWELDEDAIERIIDRLRKERFLDDERFCRSFINDKVRFNKWGRNKILFELKKKQIPETVFRPILDALSVDDFEMQLEGILRTKVKSVKAKDRFDKRNKLLRFALGRGFAMDNALRCIDKLLKFDDERFSE